VIGGECIPGEAVVFENGSLAEIKKIFQKHSSWFS
jgi:hypothetical protein